MPNFLVWNLIFILAGCLKNYLNLRKNSQLLTEARYFLENQEIQINEYKGCFSYFQYLFPGEVESIILQAYSKYIVILVRNGDRKLLTMKQVTKYLNLSSFVINAKLQNALLIKILSVHYLLHPMGGLFNAKGLTSFILKAHLYLRQLEYMGWDDDDDCGILSAIDSLHQFLYGWPEQGHKGMKLLETSLSTIKNYPILRSSTEEIEEESHPILRSSAEEIEEESTIETSKNREPLRSRHQRPRRYNRNGVYIGILFTLLFFIFFIWTRIGVRVTEYRESNFYDLV